MKGIKVYKFIYMNIILLPACIYNTANTHHHLAATSSSPNLCRGGDGDKSKTPKTKTDGATGRGPGLGTTTSALDDDDEVRFISPSWKWSVERGVRCDFFSRYFFRDEC